MMCIACELDFVWLAYLEDRGLAGPDKGTGAQAPPAAVPESPPHRAESVVKLAEPSKFSCDDPTAG